MKPEISRKKLLNNLSKLLSSEEGIITLLSGALVISDFDDYDVALEEAINAFNGNIGYFQKLISNAQKRSS